MQDDAHEMLIPGEMEYRTEQERRAQGIPLSAPLYAELVELGNELGVETELQPL